MGFSLSLPQVNAAELEGIKDAGDRKEFVGNAIYPIIQEVLGEHAGRITGMLIDESVLSFKELLTNQEYLNQKCKEAYALLIVSQQQ